MKMLYYIRLFKYRQGTKGVLVWHRIKKVLPEGVIPRRRKKVVPVKELIRKEAAHHAAIPGKVNQWIRQSETKCF